MSHLKHHTAKMRHQITQPQPSEPWPSIHHPGSTSGMVQTTFFANHTESIDQMELGELVSTQLLNHEMRRTRLQYSRNFGSLTTSLVDSTRWPQFDATVSLASKQNRRKLRLVLRAGFRLIEQHMLHFELTIGHNARSWMSIPWLGCSFTTINVRPEDSPIFRACQDGDLDSVRYLLETGQASIYDVDDEERDGLLEVRPF